MLTVLVWVVLVHLLPWIESCSRFKLQIMWTFLALYGQCVRSVSGWCKQNNSISVSISVFWQYWREMRTRDHLEKYMIIRDLKVSDQPKLLKMS